MEDNTLAEITQYEDTSLSSKKLSTEDAALLAEWTSQVDTYEAQIASLKGSSSPSNPEQLYEPIKSLLIIEKKTRVASFDAALLCKRTALLICSVPIHLQDWTKFGEYISTLCKRRNVLKKVVQAVVRLGMTELEGQELSPADRLQLITTLRDVSKGKIYVELEFARLTLMTSKIDEAKAADPSLNPEEKHKKLTQAANVMEEVTVETIGSMDKKEKVKLTLHHARLLMQLGDYIKGGIVCKKIKRHRLAPKPDDTTQTAIALANLKLMHCRLMIEYHTQLNNANLELAQDFWDIFNTELINRHSSQQQKSNTEPTTAASTAEGGNESGMDVEGSSSNPASSFSKDAWRNALERVVLCTILAENSLERTDMLKRLQNCPQLQTKTKLNVYKKLVDIHLTKNVFVWDTFLSAQEFSTIASHPMFSGELKQQTAPGAIQEEIKSALSSASAAKDSNNTKPNKSSSATSDLFVRSPPVDVEVRLVEGNDENGIMGTGGSQANCKEWARLFRLRLAEHNVRVVAGCYTTMRMGRLAEMLCLSVRDTEYVVCALVSDKKRKTKLYARVDRPNGIVTFQKPKDHDAVLQEWSSKVEEMLTLVDASCFLIEKEETLQKILKKQAKKDAKKKKKAKKQKEKTNDMVVESKA